MDTENKQIEEMAKHCHFYEEGNCLLCEECIVECDMRCDMYIFAKMLYNAGYRKASEVLDEATKLAKEIADNSATLAELEENPIKRIEAKGEQIGALVVWGHLIELRKKHTESEG